MQRLSPGALGLAVGIVWGACVLLVVLANMARPSYGADWLTALASVYPLLGRSAAGALVGFLWGLVDGVITGILVAWIYNGLVRRPSAAQ